MSIRALVREFECLAQEGTPVVAAWARRHPALADCQELPDTLAAIRADPDPVLRALLEEVAAGSSLAGRVVLQAFLPKLISMAAPDPSTGALDDYLSAFWLRTRDYPLQRRPDRIPANLVLDTLKTVRSERHKHLVLVDPLRVEQWGSVHEPARRPDARGLLRTAMDRGLIDPHIHGVLACIYTDGLTPDEAAARYRVSTTTIQRRCRRGIKSLAAHAGELAHAL